MKYKEFRDNYKKGLKKGEKFSLSSLNKSWKEYNKQPDNTGVEPIIETKAEETEIKTSVSEALVFDNQPSLEVVKSSEVIKSSEPEIKKAESQTAQVFAFDMHEELAKSVHLTIKNIIVVATHGKIKINDDDINLLNSSGGKLLKKYDENGFLQKYGLEISYFSALLGITTSVIMQYNDNKKQAEKEAQK